MTPLELIDSKNVKGCWITKNKQHVCLYVQEGLGPAIALEDENSKNPGHEFAISLSNGVPHLQVCKNGECEIVDLFDFVRAVKHLMSEHCDHSVVEKTRP